MFRLQFTSEDGHVRTVDIDQPSVTLGRSSDCDVEIADSRVSSRHALIEARDDGFTITDLESSNGTYVDEQRIDVPTAVTAASVIRIGRTSVVVELPVPVAAEVEPELAEEEVGRHTIISTHQQVAPVGLLQVADSPDQAMVGKTLRIGLSPSVIGREPPSDIVIDDDRMSGRHAALCLVEDGIHVRDMGSANGSFANDERIVEATLKTGDSLQLGRTQLVCNLPGQPAVGSVEPAESRWYQRPLVLAAVAIVAVVALAAAGVAVYRSSQPAGGMSSSELAKLEHGTVWILQVEKPGDNDADFGSGTIISPHGLILTNAHVADPRAPGTGIRDGGLISPGTPLTPRTLLISLVTDPDKPAKREYYAKVVAVDGYMDAAVLQITRKVSGAPVDPANLNLPAVKIGNSATLQPGDHLNVFGYPAAGGGQEREINYSGGSVSGFLTDSLMRTSRAMIKTDAPVLHGNSGGLAATNNGVLVGIPSDVSPDVQPGSSISYGSVGEIRPINLVKPLITAAEHQTSYTSPYFVASSGTENWKFKAVTIGPVEATSSGGCRARTVPGSIYPSGTRKFWLWYQLSGMRHGEQLIQTFQWTRVLGGKLRLLGSRQINWTGGNSRCDALTFTSSKGDGVYVVRTYVGPNGRLIARPAAFGVGRITTGTTR